MYIGVEERTTFEIEKFKDKVKDKGSSWYFIVLYKCYFSFNRLPVKVKKPVIKLISRRNSYFHHEAEWGRSFV